MKFPRDLFNYNISHISEPLLDNSSFFKASFAISPRLINIHDQVYLYLSEKGENFHKPTHWVISRYKINNLRNLKKHSLLLSQSYRRDENILSAPDVHKNKDGTFTMFFEARRGDAKSAQIHIAHSKDGKEWTDQQSILASENEGFGTPSYIKTDNIEKLFFHALSDTHYHIKSATKIEGKWVIDKGIRIEQTSKDESAIYAPHVFEFTDGTFGMLYSNWNPKGTIDLAESADLINWKRVKTVFGPNSKHTERHCSEPFLFKFEDDFFVFYEGSNLEKEWRIMCAKINYTGDSNV